MDHSFVMVMVVEDEGGGVGDGEEGGRPFIAGA
jgi:hypothetical protein